MIGLVGVAVNTATVILGSVIGLVCKKGIPQKITTAVMSVIGLCTLYIGFSGALKGQNTLITILSLVFGCVCGTLINIDGALCRLGDKIGSKSGENSQNISVGFVSAALLFCIGSMTVVGSLEAGINGDNTMIYTKSVLDLISSVVLSATLGIGVLFSAAFVLVFQGALVLLSAFFGQFLSADTVSELVCAGSVMIIALGLNLLGITKIKVANLLPSLLFVPLFCYLFSFFNF